jgi:hypothetical protein
MVRRQNLWMLKPRISKWKEGERRAGEEANSVCRVHEVEAGILAPADEEYEICGHPSVKLNMSLTNHSHDTPADIDVYVAMHKFDAGVFYTSSVNTPQAPTYGWIRAPHRAVSPQPYPEFEGELPWPTLSHRRADFKSIKPDKVYELRAELWPTGVVVGKGKTIALEVSPTDVEGAGPYLTIDPDERYV